MKREGTGIPGCGNSKYISPEVGNSLGWLMNKGRTKPRWAGKAFSEWRLLDVIGARPDALARLGGGGERFSMVHLRMNYGGDGGIRWINSQNRVSAASSGKSQHGRASLAPPSPLLSIVFWKKVV